MSKARQRKQSMYSHGRKDALAGLPFRWIKHPLIKTYEAGYNSGKRKPK